MWPLASKLPLKCGGHGEPTETLSDGLGAMIRMATGVSSWAGARAARVATGIHRRSARIVSWGLPAVYAPVRHAAARRVATAHRGRILKHCVEARLHPHAVRCSPRGCRWPKCCFMPVCGSLELLGKLAWIDPCQTHTPSDKHTHTPKTIPLPAVLCESAAPLLQHTQDVPVCPVTTQDVARPSTELTCARQMKSMLSAGQQGCAL